MQGVTGGRLVGRVARVCRQLPATDLTLTRFCARQMYRLTIRSSKEKTSQVLCDLLVDQF